MSSMSARRSALATRDVQRASGADNSARPDGADWEGQPADDGRDESRLERLDRNTVEMVQEMRVGAVGIQVLFAFLLVVPFNAGWEHVTRFDRDVYFATLSCIAVATVLLIAPSIHHRILFRHGEKAYLVRTGNQFMIVAMAFEALGLVGILVLISHVVFGGAMAAVAGALAAALLATVWFAVPLVRLRTIHPDGGSPGQNVDHHDDLDE